MHVYLHLTIHARWIKAVGCPLKTSKWNQIAPIDENRSFLVTVGLRYESLLVPESFDLLVSWIGKRGWGYLFGHLSIDSA